MAVYQPLHLLFVDLEKAYDSVPLQNLWKALEHYNISNIIIRAIKRLYENTFSKTKIGKQLSSGFYITKELRQGCSLSPTLFKIYIYSECFRKLAVGVCKDGTGDSGYDNILTANCDTLLIVQDYEDFEYMTRKLRDEYELWGLKLNVKN